ncbi:PD-(D/E)XK nuclease-like domain-containing protein [Anaerovorax odorimutans]|uniref:PD-(D/E)XK nuclease-like domain-containing protein n=1 Tax=Anaerovorax odorimutans TaxID=109327 RepID=UPI00041F978E|nr:PD-(D/E)XK nuclease-like domain-containing protein [Anaerovorax odorimutans]
MSILTNENYFDTENQLKYFGSSQFKSFMKCEAATMAEINGEYEEPKSTALLVGSFVDAHFEGTLDIFRAKHPELFTKSGDLKSDYRQAEYIIQRIERDEMFMRYMSGKKQVIKTGELFGVPWKIKIDSYHEGKAIVDLKVMKDFEPIWVDGQGRIPFVEAWGYDIQAAIYQVIEGNNLPFFIAAATKQKPESDIAIMSIPQEDIDIAKSIIQAHIQRFDDVKKGLSEPIRCEKCDYCKRTKVLTEIVSYKEI